MALKKCRECKAEISTDAKLCPRCGAKSPTGTSLRTWIFAGLFAVILYSCMSTSRDVDRRIAERSAAAPPPVASVNSQCARKDSAEKVMSLMSTMGNIDVRSDVVRFTWGAGVAVQNRENLKRLVTSFGDADACLNGVAREIQFYRSGKLEATLSPDKGLVLVN